MRLTLTSDSKSGCWSDREISSKLEDRFGFQDYSKVITDLALEADTPLTIGIYGRWGSGKTSLLKLIQDDIKEFKQRKHVVSIWINVWELSNEEETWKAFLQALFLNVRNRLPPIRRIGFDFFLLSNRVDARFLISQLLINVYRLLIVMTPILLGQWLPSFNIYYRSPFLSKIFNPTTGGIASTFLGLWLLLKPMIEATHNKLNMDLNKLLKDTPFEEQISSYQKLKKLFERIVYFLVGKNGRLVVLVDDLDRCPIDRVPDVLEALKLYATVKNCVYILGLDYTILRHTLSKQYSGYPSGSEEYLEKIIQIPFPLPPIQVNHIVEFIRRQYPDIGQSNLNIPELFAKGLEANPRKIKRALNTYRMLLDLNQVRVNIWEMEPVKPQLLAKMVIIQSRFPRLYNYLIEESNVLLQLEAASLSKEEFPPLIRPEDDLMEQRDLPALKTLLSSGDQFFMDVKEDLITYFYLTNIEKGDSYWMLPSREVRDALLCGQENRIRTQVEQIMSQTDDLAERKEINDIFIRRLKEVINQSSATNWDQRLSANYAITLFEINQNSNEEKVLLDAIQREPKDHRIRYRIGEMYNSQGHLEEASREFLEAFQLDPKNYQYKLASRQSKRELDDRIKEISTHYMRTLSKVEIDEARLVFGSGITYDPIRIHENANWPDAIAEIGSKLNGTPMIVANAITLGNHCYFPTILVTSKDEVSNENLYQMSWLIHELTHVWQYQRIGWRYLPWMIKVQMEKGERAYEFGGEKGLLQKLELGGNLMDFTPEQQADIARTYYERIKMDKDVSAWIPFIQEFQMTRKQ